MLAELMEHREKYRQSVMNALRSGNEQLIKAYVPTQGGSIQGTDLLRAQWNTVTEAQNPRLYKWFSHPLGEIERAERALSDGGASGLKEASGGSITPEMVGADLRGCRRLLVAFRDTLSQPRSFDSNTVRVLDALAQRFTHIADLLVVSEGDRDAWVDRLSPGATALWRTLEGKCFQADALGAIHKTTEGMIRLQVKEIRDKAPNRTVVRNKSSYGYFRPDKPPDWSSLSPKRKRRITTR